MAVTRVVVRPVDDRWASGIVYHFAADLDAIAALDRTPRRDADVVDDFHPAGAALRVESFVHRVGSRVVEEAGRRYDRRLKIDPSRRRAGVRSCEVHRGFNHAPAFRRKEAPRLCENSPE
jgi:hypothetical protein